MTITSLEVDDVIRVPSRSRPDVVHIVSVSVLIGATTGCTCEAGQQQQYCAHRKDIDSWEATYGFARCRTCGVLMTLEQWPTRSGPVDAWQCPNESIDHPHSGCEKGTKVLERS